VIIVLIFEYPNLKIKGNNIENIKTQNTMLIINVELKNRISPSIADFTAGKILADMAALKIIAAENI
jgi:hypothetical protein